MRLRILALSLVVCVAPSLSAAFTTDRTNTFEWAGDITAILQYNGTAMSKMTPVSSLARFSFEYSIQPGFAVVARAYASSGRNRLHRVPGADAPVNTIAAMPMETMVSNGNTWPVRLDEMGIRVRGKHVSLTAALTDLSRAWGDDDGVMNNPLSSDVADGFVNGHFVRNLAVNWTEEDFFRSVPAVVARFVLDDWITLKTGMTFGDSEYHFFIRNSGFLQCDISWSLFGEGGALSLGIGASDADKSNTHKLSPSAGVWLHQSLGRGLTVFGQFSHAEESNRVSTLFGTCLWHASGGLVWQDLQGDHRVGLGLSTARFYGDAHNEKSAEIFWRIRLFKEVFLTLDLAILKNPAGTALPGEEWVALPAARFGAAF
ncbi:MAG TPA: hypothetical protein PLM00_06045 [Spirochaetota bacterium]|nr:hypothetical protein [Spirochaetota bacterium]HPN82934.1 hypothetical protein [Spirochaetota bacterium]